MLLALANLLHHKARGLLSALAVGIGVAMLVTLLGLTHGSLDEVMDRMRAVDADLLIAPREFNTIVTPASFSDKHLAKAATLTIDGRPIVGRIAPVFLERMVVNKVGVAGKRKDMHNVFGIRAADWDFFLRQDKRLAGGGFADLPGYEKEAFDLLTRFGGLDAAAQADPDARDRLARGFQIVIDRRLADVQGLRVGDEVEGLGRTFRVAGIAPTGVTVRLFAPLATLRVINELPGKVTFMFVRLAPGVEASAAKAVLADELGATVLTLAEYGDKLAENLATIPDFTLALSAVTLAVAFLFVLAIMYTMVLQRTREIGILKSLGASDGYVVGTVLAESVLLSLAGAAIGLGLAYAAKIAIIQCKPLLTVDIKSAYVLAGVLTGAVGGLLSGLYPAWVAIRQDPMTALNYE